MVHLIGFLLAPQLLLTSNVAACSFEEPYWSPRAGTRLEYAFRQIRTDKTREWKVPYRIKQIDKGRPLVMEHDMGYYLTLRGDQQEAPPDHRIAHSMLGGFRYPDKRLKNGETWSVNYNQASERGSMAARVAVTFKGKTFCQRRPAFQFYFEFDLGSGVRSYGTAWISTEDGTLIRRENKVENYDFLNPPGPQNFREEVTLTKLEYPK